jgi:nucleoside-diphosphate-sugar epimerase
MTYADRGVRVIPARFAPTVHGEGDHGFISLIARTARRRGASVYPGEGRNRWPAVHRSDAARLVRLGLENAPAGTILHAAAEEGVPVREIAEALALRLGVPARSAPAEHIAEEIPFIGRFLAADIPATSTITRDLLGWQPTGPTLLEDIAAGHYDQPRPATSAVIAGASSGRVRPGHRAATRREVRGSSTPPSLRPAHRRRPAERRR